MLIAIAFVITLALGGEDAGGYDECLEGCSSFLQLDLSAGSAHAATQIAPSEPSVPVLAPWPHFLGPQQYGSTPNRFGRLKKAWSWHHPAGQYHSLFAGGSVIDAEGSFYQMTVQGLVKVSRHGQVLWHYATPGVSNNEPALMGSAVLGTTKAGNAFAVDRRTGETLWTAKLAESAGEDCGYPSGVNGTFVAAAACGEGIPHGGNLKVFGLNATTGETLWEYRPDHTVWNFAPLFPPGDNTVVFMDLTGQVYMLSVLDGRLIWKFPGSNASYSDGGASLGPNSRVYTCSNYGTGFGQKGTRGVARAFDLSSGSRVWEQVLPSPCNSYPAVGHVKGADVLAVVMTLGPFSGDPDLEGTIAALSAETGEELWRFDAPKFTGFLYMAAGEVEGALARLSEHIGITCGPAPWSAPGIDGDGKVYAGRMDGGLYLVHGPRSGVEELAPGMVVDNATGMVAEVLRLGSAPLHGALAFGPGTVAYSTCDTLHVFHPEIS